MITVISILMYIISLEVQLPSCVTIYNQCTNIELVSPVYFCNGAVCSKLSNQQIDIGTEMDASFEIYATQDDFDGALLYKLQKYIESDDQRNMNTLTAEADKIEAKCVQMLVVWKVKDSESFLYVVLVEHIKKFIWNKDELRKLYNKNHSRLSQCDDTISDIWFMDDDMALRISFEVRGLKGNFELSISIYEEEARHAIRPLWINTER
jgi:hypothetical protein